MLIPIKRTSTRILLLAAALALLLPGATRTTSYAAVQVPDTIRVGLFLNLPGKFTSLTPIVTLQSASGLSIAWRDPQGALPVDAAPPGMPVRYALDGYRALILETADPGAAAAVAGKLQASSQAVTITRLSKSGKDVYQVAEGVYPTAAAAAGALTKWTSAGTATGIPSAVNPRIAGPWALEAGPYASLADARAAAEQIGAAGIDAFAEIKVKDGAMLYGVRIGQEADPAAAAALGQAAAAAGALNVRVPAPGEPYAVIRSDMSLSAASGQPVPLYAIPADAGVVLRAEAAAGGTVQVAERSKRSYRGAMEVSALNGSLALVNEVNFEAYLYSVVGAEVGSGWPPEAQKAQAVAARSYALASGSAFQIAHVVDTTLSQAYNGVGSENPNSTAGVNATAGEVLTYNGSVISAVFSSNAGGVTADNLTEGWGSETGYLSSAVPSPDDGPQAGRPDWYDVVLPAGQRGYVRADLLAEAEPNAAGVAQMRVAVDGAIVRSRPDQTSAQLAKLQLGETVYPLKKVPEYTAYSWVEATYTADALLTSLSKSFKLNGPLQTLEVTGRGPSGRVTEITANGTPLTMKAADNWRGALGGVRSTLLSIEETARMTVVGAGGTTRELPVQSGPVQVIGAGGVAAEAGDSLFVMDVSGAARVVTARPTFILSGRGYGHGLGMSQFGAKKLAEQGNDYQTILKYYYKNATIEKDAKG